MYDSYCISESVSEGESSECLPLEGLKVLAEERAKTRTQSCGGTNKGMVQRWRKNAFQSRLNQDSMQFETMTCPGHDIVLIFSKTFSRASSISSLGEGSILSLHSRPQDLEQGDNNELHELPLPKSYRYLNPINRWAMELHDPAPPSKARRQSLEVSQVRQVDPTPRRERNSYGDTLPQIPPRRDSFLT
jgi:hypothetical protein